MKVLWCRATETVEIENANYTPRPYYYEIPVLREDLSRYLDYHTNDDLAISLVIAHKRSGSQYSELLIKRSFWMIKNLCERTDVQDQGVTIQLSIDDTLKELVIPYAEACGFPLGKVNWFTSKEAKYNYICKFEALFSDIFRAKKRVLHMDLSLHFGEHPTQKSLPLFERIKSFWRDESMALRKPLWRVNTPEMKANPTPIRRGIWDRCPESKHEVASYIGHSVEDEERYWRESEMICQLDGKMLGFHRDLIDSTQFVNEILELSQIGAGDDEFVIACYARKHRWTEWDTANIEKAFWDSKGEEANPYYKECSVIPAYHKGLLDLSYANFRRFWLSQHINNENLLCEPQRPRR